MHVTDLEMARNRQTPKGGQCFCFDQSVAACHGRVILPKSRGGRKKLARHKRKVVLAASGYSPALFHPRAKTHFWCRGTDGRQLLSNFSSGLKACGEIFTTWKRTQRGVIRTASVFLNGSWSLFFFFFNSLAAALGAPSSNVIRDLTNAGCDW